MLAASSSSLPPWVQCRRAGSAPSRRCRRAVAARAHLAEDGDDAARRLSRLAGLRHEARPLPRQEGGGERHTGEPSEHGDHCMCVDGAWTRRQPHDASGRGLGIRVAAALSRAGGGGCSGRPFQRPASSDRLRVGVLLGRRGTAAPAACWPRRRRRSRPWRGPTSASGRAAATGWRGCSASPRCSPARCRPPACRASRCTSSRSFMWPRMAGATCFSRSFSVLSSGYCSSSYFTSLWIALAACRAG